MKKYFSKLSTKIKLVTAVSGFSFIVGCAHELNPIKISANSSPTNEIAQQRSLIDQAYKDQVDVLAAIPLQKAESYLAKATENNQSGKSAENVLETVGYSKAYLNQALSDANQTGQKFEDVATSRRAAILAGAKNTSKSEILILDEQFRNLTEDIDTSSNVKAEEKKTLQSKYLDLELSAIKKSNLSFLQNILVQAKKKGAEKLTPKAFDEAIQKLNVAEKIIETDRHNTVQVKQASAAATQSATRLMNLLESAQVSKNQTPEQRAVMLDAREQDADHANAVATDAKLQSKKKDQQLANQSANLAVVKNQNVALKQRQEEDAIIVKAEAQFQKSEAEVCFNYFFSHV